jgi:hypothetical protein
LLTALACAPVGLAEGSFTTSDELLNRIWGASVATAEDGVASPVNLDARDCTIDLPRVILDGPVRDRCPYIGDIAVSGLTLLTAGEEAPTVRAMLAWFASVQNPDGSIPDSPIHGHGDVLMDYNGYWIEALYDYTLWTGDVTLLRSVYPNLERLVDGFYLRHLDGNGLLANYLGNYALIRHAGSRVSYFDAQYIRALRQAGSLAEWSGNRERAAAWRARASALTTPFSTLFWDAHSGAFTDTPGDMTIHPLDGNVFAVLAGVGTAQQQQSTLGYIARTMATKDGDVITGSSDSLEADTWGSYGTTAIYPFIGYYELLADYAAGADAYALGLIRREWGFMLQNGPGRMWEAIDLRIEEGLGPDPSLDHGWSSGAATVLTGYVLGVQPTSPGFATFTVTPHPGDLQFARGTVPTPHGPLTVSLQLVGGTPVVSVVAPMGTVWSNRTRTARR